jgi:RNA polymerase sigma factor (TIGR02999 family)
VSELKGSTPPDAQQLTALLIAWNRGDRAALDAIMPLVHGPLRRLARQHMALEKGRTLQPTALVNEVYLRLVDMKRVAWTDRAHFYAVCARVMRHVLVDLARARKMKKRDAGAACVSLGAAPAAIGTPQYDVLDIDRALEELATFDARRSRVVELRVFGGLTVQESADVLGVSPDTVTRDWKLAKAWLLRRLA